MKITRNIGWSSLVEVYVNGKKAEDCLMVDLAACEVTCIYRNVRGEKIHDGNGYKTITLKGDIELRFSSVPSGVTTQGIIEDMRFNVLWNALSEDQRRWRFNNPQSTEPLPRDEESRALFRKAFNSYYE